MSVKQIVDERQAEVERMRAEAEAARDAEAKRLFDERRKERGD